MIINDSISQKYSIKLSDRTYLDQDGYLVCQDAIFGRVGVYKYLKGELGILGNPKEVVQLLRKPEYVFDEESLSTLDGRPLTLGHPTEKVNIDNYNKYAKGFVQNVRHDDLNIIGDIRITDKKVRDLVLSHKMRELSLGYDMALHQDEDNTYFCKDIVYNHLALVLEGRAGNAMILDENTVVENLEKGGNIMLDKTEVAQIEVNDSEQEEAKVVDNEMASEEVSEEPKEEKVEEKSEEVADSVEEKVEDEVANTSNEVVKDKCDKEVVEKGEEKEMEKEIKDTNYYVSKIKEIELINDQALKEKLLNDIKAEMGIETSVVDTMPTEVKVEINDNDNDFEDHATKMQRYYNSFDPHLYGNDCSSKEYKEMQRKNTITKSLKDLYLEK